MSLPTRRMRVFAPYVNVGRFVGHFAGQNFGCHPLQKHEQLIVCGQRIVHPTPTKLTSGVPTGPGPELLLRCGEPIAGAGGCVAPVFLTCDRPKSHTLTVQLLSTSKLPVLRSRCCAARRACEAERVRAAPQPRTAHQKRRLGQVQPIHALRRLPRNVHFGGEREPRPERRVAQHVLHRATLRSQ